MLNGLIKRNKRWDEKMPINLKRRHFLTLKHFTSHEIHYLLNLSQDLKEKKRAGILGDLLKGKNIVSKNP